jgi:hypothetical protein
MRRVSVVALLLVGILLAAGPAMEAQPVGRVRVDYLPTGVPQHMNLQGYLTDTSGVPITDTLSMVFKIWRGVSAVWTETQNNCAVLNGLFSVGLGIVTPTPFTVFEPGTACSLQVTVGTDVLPKVEITSVGFAYRSVKSDTAVYALSGQAQQYVDSAGGAVRVGGRTSGNSSGQVPISNGTSCSNLNADFLDGYHASNLPAPAHDHMGQIWNSPTCTLYVDTGWSGSYFNGILARRNTEISGSQTGLGARVDVRTGGGGDVYGVFSDAYSDANCEHVGGFFRVDRGTGTRRAVWGRSYTANSNTSPSYAGYFDVHDGGTGRKYGVYSTTQGASGDEVWAGYFNGDVNITGTLSKGAGSFLIDHPLDPLNKTLRHNFVESPENLCMYRGKVRLSADGSAVVNMPSYFVALTKETEATAVVTPVGRPFTTGYEWNTACDKLTLYGEAGREASYVVLADRDDPVMRQLRRPVEQVKGNGNFDKGRLLYPRAYGYPQQLGVDYCRQIEDEPPSARREVR